jgi:rod shape-determining protein MreC
VFAALALVSVLLLVIDASTGWLAGPRRVASIGLLPVVVLADAPTRFGRFIDDSTGSRAELLGERDDLRAEVERLNLELQRLAVLESENARLRMLLESKRRMALRMRAAEIIGVVPNPATRQVVVDKGTRDGAYIGQPVVDADGVVGQVVDVTPVSSRVMLLTDAAHAVPATVVRSGFRVVVAGIGDPDVLEVRHVTESGDIAEGDLLITSGLDQRFPAGYPVARITSVDRETGDAFARVRAVPLAKLERESHVLLVFTPPARPLLPRAAADATRFTLPAGTLPAPTPPVVPVPGTAVPGAVVPGAAVPGAVAPGAAVPGAVAPRADLPPVNARTTLPYAPPPAPGTPLPGAPGAPPAGVRSAGPPAMATGLADPVAGQATGSTPPDAVSSGALLPGDAEDEIETTDLPAVLPPPAATPPAAAAPGSGGAAGGPR